MEKAQDYQRKELLSCWARIISKSITTSKLPQPILIASILLREGQTGEIDFLIQNQRTRLPRQRLPPLCRRTQS